MQPCGNVGQAQAEEVSPLRRGLPAKERRDADAGIGYDDLHTAFVFEGPGVEVQVPSCAALGQAVLHCVFDQRLHGEGRHRDSG